MGVKMMDLKIPAIIIAIFIYLAFKLSLGIQLSDLFIDIMGILGTITGLSYWFGGKKKEAS